MSKEAMNVLFFDNGTASHVWRIDGIADRANTRTPHSIFVTSGKAWNNNVLDSDIVVLELITSPEVVDTCHKQGAKVIWEADDALIDSYGSERRNLMEVEGNFRDKTIETIQKCDAMIVTTEVLKENYARFFKGPIYVLPNYVNFDYWGTDKLNITRTSDEIRIGWFGSRGHVEDLEMVAPAIKRVLDKFPTAKFVYCGFGGMSSDKKSTEIGWGEDIFKEIPRDRREFYIGVPEDVWPMKLRTLDLDIGICPLVDDGFNKNKTPIKWMEYAIAGVPAVCSPTLYSEVVKHGKTGLIAKDEDEWVKNISALVGKASLREELAGAALKEIKANWDLENHWEDWLDVYNKVLSS